MAAVFLQLYDFFHKKRIVFWSVFLGSVMLLALGAVKIEIEEDISKFFPDDPRIENLQDVFQHSKFVERMVIMVSARDSAALIPDSLVTVTETMVGIMEREMQPYVRKISSRVTDDKILEVYHTVHEFLPVFLDEDDYEDLDSLTKPENIALVLQQNYRQLISPSGVALKRIIAEDPLGFSFLALRKLQQLRFDQNFELYDNYIMTKDHGDLIFFIEPAYSPQETRNNGALIQKLNTAIDNLAISHPSVKVTYFGATAVAVGNARQLRNDSILTITIMVVLLCVLLIGFFRKKRAPFLILIPVAFGGLFSLCCIYLIKGSVSILALAAGSIILGIAVNYALHFLVHLRHTNNVRDVIKDLANPLTLGSATTVLAFFCLQFAKAAVLRDVGLFAGFSLIGAALCSLIFLPHVVSQGWFKSNSAEPSHAVGSVFISKVWERRIVWSMILITPIFFYFARQVNFNNDMSKLNFMTPETHAAQVHLESINRSSLGTVYVVSRGNDLEHALRKAEQVVPLLEGLEQSGTINKFSSPTLFLVSDSLQQKRIETWNAFWTSERRQSTMRLARQEGALLKFSDKVMQNLDSMIGKSYVAGDSNAFHVLRTSFFDDYIIEKENSTSVMSLVNVSPQQKESVYRHLALSSSFAVDRQMLTNLFVEYVHADFNFIVTITAILVFMALFLSYGRIELTIITFAPMFITWIWILGIMALLDIEFNIVNIMVSTFIFGLGDDYSIFIMDGLQQEYRTGRKSMSSIRTSIFLSGITTIAGLGVLILAKHPALRSIASISIIGIGCVLIMSQTVEPFLFRFLITDRTSKGLAPMTWAGILRTLFTYTYFVVTSLLVTALGLLLNLVPFGRKSIRYAFHGMIRLTNALLIYLAPNLRTRVIGRSPETFARASVIVANHTSFLDILLTTMLHPKLVLMTNKWVWNSPVFGGVVRLAGYYPASDGAEESVRKLKARTDEGYSVVIFPEGKRSEDSNIRRFHKGAFYIAEALQLPIQPLLIHGAASAIPKGSFYLNGGDITLKFLRPILSDEARFGNGYSDRSKQVGRFFKQEFVRLANEMETPAFFRARLISNYLYKGPVLEWYLRIKIRLERDYETFHRLLPVRGNIVDLGCGYGFMCYMLQFLSVERTITGVDYDEEKIETAQQGYARTDKLTFHHADVTTFPLNRCEGIVISDVLHYLAPERQKEMLMRCFDALNPGGILIIRDGNADMIKRHRFTKLTEFFSVKLLKFNKAVNELHFVSGSNVTQLAAAYGLNVEVLDDAKFTSNVIFAIRKPGVQATEI